jgi:hypothetical protein
MPISFFPTTFLVNQKINDYKDGKKLVHNEITEYGSKGSLEYEEGDDNSF